MQFLAFLVNFGPQNVPLMQTSGNFLGWLHMVWCVFYQIKPLVLDLVTLNFSPLSSGLENLWPSVLWVESNKSNPNQFSSNFVYIFCFSNKLKSKFSNRTNFEGIPIWLHPYSIHFLPNVQQNSALKFLKNFHLKSVKFFFLPFFSLWQLLPWSNFAMPIETWIATL